MQVSSWDMETKHPLYMADSARPPQSMQRWLSNPTDPSPWLELHWHTTQNIEGIFFDLPHDGVRSAQALLVTCWTDEAGPTENRRQKRIEVEVGPQWHELLCKHTYRLRVQGAADCPRQFSSLHELNLRFSQVGRDHS